MKRVRMQPSCVLVLEEQGRGLLTTAASGSGCLRRDRGVVAGGVHGCMPVVDRCALGEQMKHSLFSLQ